MHKIQIHPEILSRVRELRAGGAFFSGRLEPRRTAHIIVDLQNGFLEPGAPVEMPFAREIVPNVNRIADALRQAGGQNYYLRFTTSDRSQQNWSAMLNRWPLARRQAIEDAFRPGSHWWALSPQLELDPLDRCLDKTRYSAFIPGTCRLPNVLLEHDIKTVIVSGTTTHCCCESTARDAMQANYQVIFVADATAAPTDREHNAALNNMCALFADVLTTDEVLREIGTSPTD